MRGSCNKSVEPGVNADQSNHSYSRVFEQLANLIGQRLLPVPQICCNNHANLFVILCVVGRGDLGHKQNFSLHLCNQVDNVHYTLLHEHASLTLSASNVPLCSDTVTHNENIAGQKWLISKLKSECLGKHK